MAADDALKIAYAALGHCTRHITVGTTYDFRFSRSRIVNLDRADNSVQLNLATDNAQICQVSPSALIVESAHDR